MLANVILLYIWTVVQSLFTCEDEEDKENPNGENPDIDDEMKTMRSDASMSFIE